MKLQTLCSNTALTLAIFGLVIGANNLSVALALGAIGQRWKQGRILLVFAGFEFFVPLIGVWLGQQMAGTLVAGNLWVTKRLSRIQEKK